MRDKTDGKPFEYRPGLRQFPRWEGVRHDADPGSLPLNALALGVNVRFDPAGVRSRYGINPIATLPTFSPSATWGAVPQEQVYWLGMHHMQYHAPRLWIASPGCFGGDVSTGGFVRWYNPDKSPETQTAGNYVAESERLPPLASFGGEMYFGDWASLQRPNVLETPRGAPVMLAARESYTEQVLGYPGFDATAMQEFDGKLFIALSGATTQVGYWDGTTMVLNDLASSTAAGANFCVWRDTKLVMVETGSDEVQIRDLSGSWSTVTLPFALNHSYKNSMVEFRDEIYIAPGRSAIYKISNFESPTVSTATALSVGNNAMSVAVLGDNLYFLYNTWTGAAYETYLGMYEPDLPSGNWFEGHAQIDVQVSSGFRLPPAGTTMTAYRNRLYVGGGQGRVVTHTLINDPTSAWFDAVGSSVSQGVATLRVG